MTSPLEPFGAVPTRQQLAWQEMGMYAFIHFTVNTFTDREWGDGTEPESIFNPTDLDCGQWCRVVAGAGFKGIVLTAKHHDGFCLWPSRYTTHTVARSPWRNGRGDVVAELAAAAKAHGLKLGLYLSPCDRHEKTYGSGEAYNAFYRNQLRELLTTYGGPGGRDIFITWFDGACGEGPNGKVQTYDYDGCAAVIREFAPEAVIFGHMGGHRDIRWCGNEEGFAGLPNWATLDDYVDRAMDPGLQHGQRGARHWWPSEVDVSIRPGWFYHAREDGQVRPLQNLLDIYYHSVGRGACLNLNFPPDRRGLIHENDAARIREWRTVLDRTFAVDFCAGRGHARDGSGRLTDGDLDTFWTPPDGATLGTAVVELGQTRRINVVKLREYTPLGQRVAAFAVDGRGPDGVWRTLAEETTVSFRRLVRVAATEVDALRLRITEAPVPPCLQEFGAYYQPPLRFAPVIRRDADGIVTLAGAPGTEIRYTTDGSAPDGGSTTYVKPFRLAKSGTVRAVARLPEGEADAWPEIAGHPEATLAFGLARRSMRIVSADSEAGETHRKEHILDDGDAAWMSAPGCPYPHGFILDAGTARRVTGFIFTPRPDAAGLPMRYRVWTGSAPDGRFEPAADGAFENIRNHPVPQRVLFERPVDARFFKVEFTEAADDASHVNVRRFELIG